MRCLRRCGGARFRAAFAHGFASALWGEKAGLAMFCPITLSGKAAKRNYGKHESPYVRGFGGDGKSLLSLNRLRQ
ncbi:hypothetical protein FYZ44_08880 [Mobiluncus mulieris]|nr:hypothetical protein [Mobiluncus mulieris]MCU9976140.1 hypothetical protein [Mobiluncus mulieris]MCU9994555.1 hypothetical protein [Mobiluncus mulieris]MCU9996969.1 hypothetical protein [Mobiluncus mulieris]MCV0014294.1 hypothetical protein [Mobiluncus mulieris]